MHQKELLYVQSDQYTACIVVKKDELEVTELTLAHFSTHSLL